MCLLLTQSQPCSTYSLSFDRNHKTENRVSLTNMMIPHRLSTIPHAASLGPQISPRIFNGKVVLEMKKNLTSLTCWSNLCHLFSQVTPEVSVVSTEHGCIIRDQKWHSFTPLRAAQLAHTPKSFFRVCFYRELEKL